MDNLQPLRVGGCAGVAPAKQQDCLNSLVDQGMQEQVQQVAQGWGYTPHPVMPPVPAAAPVPAPVPVPVPVRAVALSPGRRLRQSGAENQLVRQI